MTGKYHKVKAKGNSSTNIQFSCNLPDMFICLILVVLTAAVECNKLFCTVFKSWLLNMCGRKLFSKIPVSPCPHGCSHVSKDRRQGMSCLSDRTVCCRTGHILAARYPWWQSRRILSANQDRYTDHQTGQLFSLSINHVYFLPVMTYSDHQSWHSYWQIDICCPDW